MNVQLPTNILMYWVWSSWIWLTGPHWSFPQRQTVNTFGMDVCKSHLVTPDRKYQTILREMESTHKRAHAREWIDGNVWTSIILVPWPIVAEARRWKLRTFQTNDSWIWWLIWQRSRWIHENEWITGMFKSLQLLCSFRWIFESAGSCNHHHHTLIQCKEPRCGNILTIIFPTTNQQLLNQYLLWEKIWMTIKTVNFFFFLNLTASNNICGRSEHINHAPFVFAV